MKKSRFLIAALLFALVSCGASSAPSKKDMPSIDLDTYIAEGKNTNALGEFDLLSPGDTLVLDEVNEFKWEASSNAETYMLEICSDPNFVKNIETVDYYSKENIKATSFYVYSQFTFKDHTYYWRVTAKNSSGTKESKSTFTFKVQAPDVQEYKLDLGEADDWRIHNDGANAEIAIDDNNFFGNDEKSLKVSFKKEDTINRGWLIVTRTVEKNIHGTDALFFNMYYAGQDSNVIIRLVDRDNEYWYCPVQTSINAKQTVVMKFEDFIQRKGDVYVGNQEFNYERIKYFEVVFEETFGDGVLLMSGVKAIKFDNYKDEFIDKVNFSYYDKDRYTYESYDFPYEINDDELTLNYYSTETAEHGKINGYGFLKLNLNCHIYGGDAFKVSVKYTGSKGSDGGANAIIRIYEEDTDRYSYKIPYSSLVENEYRTLVIPFKAFAKSAIQGDGKRQFYYIINLQFGLEKMYGNGTLSFKDFSLVKVKDYQTETARVVGPDGLVEDFSRYEFNSDIYKIWTVSEDNKDEYMDLYKASKVAGDGNYVAGSFLYKCDMKPATYYLPIENKNAEFKALSLWLCDQSLRDSRDQAMGVKEWNPDLVLYFRTRTGDTYSFLIEKLSPIWHKYNVPFANFKNTKTGKSGESISSTNITHIGLSLQFYYMNPSTGLPMPLYTDDNPVLIDNIYLSTNDSLENEVKEKVLTKDNDNYVYFDNFESYENNESMYDTWSYSSSRGFEERELSDDVSSKGGTQSLKMKFRGNKDGNGASPSYHIVTNSNGDNASKVLVVHLKSDVAANIYLNLFIISSGKEYKYRASIFAINSVWTEYVVPINKFIIDGGSTAMKMDDTTKISRLSIGMDFNSDSNDHYVYIDNVYLDLNRASYPTKIVGTIIDA